MKIFLSRHTFLLLVLIFMVGSLTFGQRRKGKRTKAPVQVLSFDEKLYDGLEYRNLGPFRGGRSAAVTGVPGKPNLYYFGATGGGVWRTQDGGNSWENISDGYFGGSIGAVAVSEYDNNVIYVGGGEKTVRGNVSYGYGVWKSVDAGKTWQQMGLKESRHISRIRIHPQNPDIAWAAVMGNLFTANEQRGVFKTTDGGQTWRKVLFVNAEVGAVDLELDPTNPRIMFASTWRVKRTPYDLSSGGEGSGLWKSTDGGENWTEITKNEGLPKGVWGISAVTVSPINPERVWAIIENEKGGVYRSDDGGKEWKKVNDSRALRQRAWYYTRIYADTKDENMVYVVNVDYHRSTDGGKTFTAARAPHGDHHDLWIAPEDNQRMIIGDDGGAQVSFDAGDNWTTYLNQPTSQIYRVTTDNHFPYRIYGAQQDNSAIRIAHRSGRGSISERDWESTAGGESAHIAVDPEDNDIVYGGSYGGFLSRLNHKTGEVRVINVWPDNPMGYGAEGAKYRFQWNFPVAFSPHNADKLYAASNQLHVSYNEGQSWETISPDLTRNDPSKLGSSGGPITKDNTGVEYYCTIFAIAESPSEKDLIWVGSDDGLLHVTKDGGKNWENVTPTNMPEWIMVNSIDVDPFTKGGAYVAATMYKWGDFKPYLFKTKDYGKTWTQITQGIDPGHFTRVVRADPKRQGLLYAGTESGMYVSFDDGTSWKPFQLKLPIVPITDLAVKNDNLVVATQGRGFWVIDDLTVLHQLNADVTTKAVHLYQPIKSYRMPGSQARNTRNAGQNHPGGVNFYFYLKDEPDSAATVKLDIMTNEGEMIRSFSSKAKKPQNKLTDLKAGTNHFTWNMRYADTEGFDGLILWAASLSGPVVVPGTYKAKLTTGDLTSETTFEIVMDPRAETSQEDLEAQFSFVKDVQDKVEEVHVAIKHMRAAKKQLNTFKSRISKDSTLNDLVNYVKQMDSTMTAVENALYQTKNRSRQDPLNFPIKLNNKLAYLTSVAGRGNFAPTDQSIAFKNEVVALIDKELELWYQLKNEDLPKFNAMVKERSVDAIILKE